MFRGRLLRNCFFIALGVGSLLSLINQYESLRFGPYTTRLLTKIAMNFAIPFMVSMLSAAANQERRQKGRCNQTSPSETK